MSVEQDKLDAKRYRWLRERDWTEKGIAVVADSRYIKLGSDCPSHERLDKMIDKNIKQNDNIS